MLKRISKSLAIVSFAMLMIACEGETTYTKTITNHSNDTVSFLIYSQWEYMEDSVLSYPNTSETIYIFSHLGGTDTPIICTAEFDSIIVKVNNDNVLKRDIMDNDNWNYNIKSNKRRSIVDHYCDFEIKNEDIESLFFY